MNGQAGKGDRYRPVDKKKWDENYDRIFGRKNAKTNQNRKPRTGKTEK